MKPFTQLEKISPTTTPTTSSIINSILHIFGVILLLNEIKNVREALKKKNQG